MAEYPTTLVPVKLKDFLQKIPQMGIPQKVTTTWLKTLGYTSSNDASIVRVLKAIHFVDDTGNPTERWKQFRGSNGGVVLAQALYEVYEDLFNLYPNAHSISHQQLQDYFRPQTSGGAEAVKRMANTFSTLTSLANFQQVGKENNQLHTETIAAADPELSKHIGSRKSQGITVNLNLQLTLPESTNAKLLEDLFSSMSKHLFPDG